MMGEIPPVPIGVNRVICGDCLEEMPKLPNDFASTIITDPPYGLGFMGKEWDHGSPGVAFWKEALRVAKPGAFMLIFGGTRTFHRLTCAIEDAGWEIRDCMMWLYGSGFPKSHDISKAIDKAATVKETIPATDLARKWDGWGTALKPAWEPIIVAMKPLDGTFAQNAERHGVAGLWIDGGRIGPPVPPTGSGPSHVYNWANTEKVPYWPGSSGRWPANLILDEEAAEMLGEPSRFFYCAKASKRERNMGCENLPVKPRGPVGEGLDNTLKGPTNALRKDKPTLSQNNHPTVKPLALMEYLCKLTKTPDGGIVLDPFGGSGTTALACLKTGRKYILIEKEREYCEIAKARISALSVSPAA